jgi:hypothetical protein
MGVVASDAVPEKKSDICTRGKGFPAHQFTHPKWCPISILFSWGGGVFRRHFPRILNSCLNDSSAMPVQSFHTSPALRAGTPAERQPSFQGLLVLERQFVGQAR